MVRFDALDYALSRAQWYADQAKLAVASLPLSDAQEVLLLLPDSVVTRAQ